MFDCLRKNRLASFFDRDLSVVGLYESLCPNQPQ